MKCITSTIKPGMTNFLSFLLKGFALLLVFLLPLYGYSADYYWVSSATTTANKWSNAANWRTTSGGAVAHAAPPTAADNVFFDANSFTATSNTITMDVNAYCNNMDWTGVTNTPSMIGGSGFFLDIAGNLVLSSNMVQTGLPPSFVGIVNFSATSAGKTITMANKIFADVAFKGTGGGWIVQDNLNVLGSLLLQAGTLNTNGKPVNCGFLNANAPGDAARSLVLGSSVVTVTNSQVDLRGDTPNFVLDAGSATMVMSYNSGNINLYAGVAAKTLPNLVFSLSVAPNSVNIHTSSNTSASSRITFKDITTSSSGATVNINGAALKTFGKLSFAAKSF
ncbi:MAG TPA: hypothetical protein VEX63_10620 [Flavisolibacter sp.]|nr:hypothetical protein [Flavisolibacter sp.]